MKQYSVGLLILETKMFEEGRLQTYPLDDIWSCATGQVHDIENNETADTGEHVAC